ncbi:MAG TPA: malonyl-CoA decarboxylase [Paracoccaceae bacterium]|nr:malonyl-CoA decarboxylase [Paracoccaceae bacterium]
MKSTTLLGDLLTRVTEVGRSLTQSGTAAEAGPAGLLVTCEQLLKGEGEATGLARARQILDRYARFTPEEKAAFFKGVTSRFGVDGKGLEAAIERWREGQGDAEARAIHYACEPRSLELFRRLNRAPGGARDLVAMRADLLRAMREDPGLAVLDADFQHLFVSWFNRGFLELRRIDWSSPAEILEKIIAYEAVHEINGWDDLRRRVAAPDRRLYAFFHPALSGEPLIFVEVALTEAIPAAIGPILADGRRPLAPKSAATAVFYSISNCQEGLRGISFGNFLIKQVVEELQREFPGLKTFVTLSPVPGFRGWAEEVAGRGEEGLLAPAECQAVAELREKGADWAAIAAREELLAPLAARYLLEARRPRGGPVDSVARFHLGNGARLERINTGADRSARGIRSSWGVMVNYLYDLDRIERNHEAFANGGEVIASPAIRRLLKRRKVA